jgi:2-(1,2-epoxy-1,2-dihydrophenyl)acetyl-CoA isomerase
MTFYEDLVRSGHEDARRVVRVERGADRAVVTLDDPEKLNVLSAPLVIQLRAALQELVAAPEIRTVVITGADPGFSAGGDLRMMDSAPGALASPEGSTDIWRWIRNEFGGIARLIARGDTAFIAAVNGPAAGVGLAWALTCDLVIASECARIVPAFGRLGLLPEVGTSWALTRRLGYQGAFAFYAGGEKWCTRIAALPAHAVAMTKPLLRAAADVSW